MTAPTSTQREVVAISLALGALSIRDADEGGFRLTATDGTKVRELMEHDDLETMMGLTHELVWAKDQDAVDDVLERMRAASEPVAAFGP